MTDENFVTILSLQLMWFQAQVDVLGKILVQGRLCSAEGLESAVTDYVTRHAREMSQYLRDDIASYVEAIVQRGDSFESCLQRLLDDRGHWHPSQGGS